MKSTFSRGVARAVAIVFFAFMAATLAAQSATFTYLTTFSPGFVPTDVRVADVTGSSAPDIILLSNATSIVRVLENTGINQIPPFVNVPVGTSPRRLFTADANGDGATDILTANTLEVSVLIRTGATWNRTDYPLSAAGEVRVFDVNGDGLRDLVRGTQAAYGLAGGGFANVASTIVTLVQAVSDVYFGDFNGDLLLDLVTLRASGSNLILDCYLNLGAGSFAAPVATTVPSGMIPLSSRGGESVADMNLDGRDDLVLLRALVPTNFNYNWPGFLGIWSGQTSGAFLSGFETQIYCSSAPYAIESPILRDLNGDGIKDVVVRGNLAIDATFDIDQYVTLRSVLNSGSGYLYDLRSISGAYAGFGFHSVPPVESRCQAFGDLNGDGAPDLVAQSPGGGLSVNNLDIFLGSSAPAPALSSLTLSITSGQNQTLPVASIGAVGAPLEVTVSANGQPVQGATVLWTATGATLSPCGTTTTDGFGRATQRIITGPTPGPITVTATLANGSSVTFNAQAASLAMSIVQGAAQVVTLLGNPPIPTALVVPCTVLVTDVSTGLPAPNVVVTFASSVPNVFAPFFTPTNVITDALGRASMTPIPFATAIVTITARLTANGSPATFIMAINGPTLQIAGGANQAADPSDVFAAPLDVLVLDALGQPMPNVPVTFVGTNATTANSFAIANPTPLSDATGHATTTVQALPMNTNGGIVRATIPWSATALNFTLFIRRLTVSGTAAGGGVTFWYQHEHGPTPLILTVETPPQTPVTTPYGTIATSILAPLPGLFVLDSSGTYGIADPNLIANPSFTRAYTVSPSLAGFTFVSQIIGFDAFYFPDLSQAIFVSNAVVRTL